MKTRIAAMFLAALAAASIRSISTAAPDSNSEIRTNVARRIVQDWPEYSRDLAAMIIFKYGPPDRMETSRLTWAGKRPWKQIVVFRDALDSSRWNGLQQSIGYRVPPARRRALGAFDRGVSYDSGKRELVVRTDDESTNCLALNLADEVIRGRRSPENARAFYDRTLSVSFSGKNSAYMRRLRFRAEP
jgi:hypothetical protein